MGDVKRWDCMMGATVRETAEGEFVTYEDYAALEAENAKLKGEYEWVASINTALDESNQSAWAENAKLRAELERNDEQYPPCDYCGVVTDYHPWHGSGPINGRESPHIHACNECRHLLPSAPKADDPVKQMLLDALESAADALARAEFFEQADNARATISAVREEVMK